MKIVFFGTSRFAVPSLEAIKEGGFEIPLVVTQPSRRGGRGQKFKEPPIKITADKMGLEVYQVDRMNDTDFVKKLKVCDVDLFVVVSFGGRLPKELLEISKRYSINLHASLLPKYRGPAPVNWAIINGDEKTGITIISMAEDIDTGEIMLQRGADIEKDDDAETLSERLAEVGAEALLEVIENVKAGKVTLKKQNDAASSWAPKLKKSDGLIDWNLSARDIHNRIRGLVPWPCAYTYLSGKMLKIWHSGIEDVPIKSGDCPGSVLDIVKDRGIYVATSKGALIIKELQLEGGKRMTSDAFLRGHKVGDTFHIGGQFLINN